MSAAEPLEPDQVMRPDEVPPDPNARPLVPVDTPAQRRRPKGYRRGQNRTLLPDRHLVIDRRRRAYQLRVGGFTYDQIGRQLHADPSVQPQNRSTPGGYGWSKYVKGQPPLIGDALVHAVTVDIREGMRQAQEREQWALEEYRRRELDYLDHISAAIEPRVLTGDLWAVDRAINLSARRSKILGLDIERVEQTSEVNVTVQGVQPDYSDTEFAPRFFGALEQVGAIEAGKADEILDVIDVDGEDVEEGEVVHRDG